MTEKSCVWVTREVKCFEKNVETNIKHKECNVVFLL